MIAGELLALVSALFYGVGGVAIARGRAGATGDNGVFLSVAVTAGATFAIWTMRGSAADVSSLRGLALFALAGFFSTVLGRHTMYRATERIGAVTASLFRRLIPVFSIPVSLLLLSEAPDAKALAGGAAILLGVFVYARPGGGGRLALNGGVLLAIASAFVYAASYGFRRLGLEEIPDPVFGAFVGALVGLIWLPAQAMARRAPGAALRGLFADRGPWQWLAALSFTLGQTVQFFALQFASVPRVAAIGSLEVFFSAALAAWVFRTETLPLARFALAGGLAAFGTGVMFF